MCGRYNLVTDAQALIDFFQVANRIDIQPRYNIAPSQDIVVVRQQQDERQLACLYWGLIPFWARERTIGKHTINARAETVAEKPAFRAAFRRRRCLVPATGFYEWKRENGRKQPYNIHAADGGLFAFAGLWEQWKPDEKTVIQSCTIIVTQANEAVAPIHDRMPVILPVESYQAWLDPGNEDLALLKTMLKPCPSSWISVYPVSTRVNSPYNDDAACIAPVNAATA